MKHLSRFAFILIFLFSTPSMFLSAGYEENGGLSVQELSGEEIVSSVQPVAGSKTIRCEVMGLIPAPIERVWEVISDYNGYDKLMPLTLTAFLVRPEIAVFWQGRDIRNWNKFEKGLAEHRLEKFGNNPFYLYSRFKMPWPLQDRHFVLKIERFPEIFKSQWVEIVGNTRVNEGAWQLASFENNSGMTLAVYTLYIDPGIALPKKIIQNGMKGIPEIIRLLRLRVQTSLQVDEFSNEESRR